MNAKLLSLAEKMDVHVHTPYSACCEDITIESLVEKAERKRIVYAITDHSSHLYFPRELAWCMNREDFKDLLEKHRDNGKRKIAEYLKQAKQSGAWVGIELDIHPDGTLIFEEEYFAELDLVLGAVHYLASKQKKKGATEIIAEFKRLTELLLSCGKVDILAHPFRILLYQNQAPVDDALIMWLVDRAGMYGVALEINSHYPFYDADVKMAKLAMKNGVNLFKGTDAHKLSEFGEFAYQEKILCDAHAI